MKKYIVKIPAQEIKVSGKTEAQNSKKAKEWVAERLSRLIDWEKVEVMPQQINK